MNSKAIAISELSRTRLGHLAEVTPVNIPLENAVIQLRQLYEQAERPTREAEQGVLEETLRIALLSDGNIRILDGCAAILARLGHFPSLASLKTKHKGWTPNLPLRVGLDAAARIVGLAPHGDTESPYTPFQAELYDALNSEDSVSFSAPTSSGKSFVLGRILYDLAALQRKNVAYVVPTRALIREVSGRIRRYLRSKSENNPIRTSPSPLPGSHVSAGHIYVVTQERLLALLAEGPSKIHLDILMVDEAHEVQQQSSRGLLLETAVELARRHFPKIRVLLASPGIPNPEYLLGITQLPRLHGIGHRDRRSPVLHNYFEVRFEGDTARVLHHQEGQNAELAKLTLSKVPENEILAAWLAHQVHQPESTTLVYCRGPRAAEVAADWLYQQVTETPPFDKEVEALAKFIETDIHPRHPLAPMLRKRIATHYGDLPATVRVRIEELASGGKLAYVCCTSTLLSGVNLPCRNLVMFDPRTGGGAGTPLDDSQIRNLAGRAGRVDSDLVGNVWVASTLATAARMPTETLSPIESGFQKELRSGAAILEVIDAPTAKSQDQFAYASAFAARAFDLQERGVTLASTAASPDTSPTLAKADNRIQRMREEVLPEVPGWILRRHHGVSPSIIQGLLRDMLNEKEIPAERLERWIPIERRIHPADVKLDEAEFADEKPSTTKYGDCVVHFAKVNKYLARHFKDARYIWPPEAKNPKDHKPTWRLATIAALWVNGLPLKWIIQGALEAAAKNPKEQVRKENEEDEESETPPAPLKPDELLRDPRFVRKKVRGTIDTLEDDIRFRMAQRWRLVMDLLTHIYTEVRPNPKLLEPMIDLPMWLEFGTISQEALDVMALGFGRATTKYIRRAMRQEGIPIQKDASNVIDWLNSLTPMRIRNWEMPPELWLELCVVSGRDPAEVVWPTG